MPSYIQIHEDDAEDISSEIVRQCFLLPKTVGVSVIDIQRGGNTFTLGVRAGFGKIEIKTEESSHFVNSDKLYETVVDVVRRRQLSSVILIMF